MKFLPADNITFKTKLKEAEVISRLSNIVEPRNKLWFGFYWSRLTKPYEGRIEGSAFYIKRAILYRNSFLPRINGVIHPDFDGTLINVKLRLHVFVMIFLVVWCGAAGFGGIAILIEEINRPEFNPATLIPFGMLLFIYALTMCAFKYESNKSKKDLEKIFEAEIIDE